MYLEKDEERILEGERGPVLQRAMELLVALGEMKDAEGFVEVRSVQVSGVSYKTIGEAGLEFLEDWAKGGVESRVLATLNPMGVDLDTWKDFGFPPDFVEKQRRIIAAYEEMGIIPSCTCTPYLAGNLPRFAEDIAWAESSSVVFANSVLGARTNRESGPSALASALLGRTPLSGLHLEEERRPTFTVRVGTEIKDIADYAALGFYLGQNFDGIPYIKGVKGARLEELKALGAALGTGRISMFHMEGATPEASRYRETGEVVDFGGDEKTEVMEALNTTEDTDILCIGCPHCSMKEVLEVIRANPKRETWVYTTRQTRAMLEGRVKNRNIRLISDTCMVVSPLEEMGIESLGTNSAKCAFYSQNLSGIETRFDTLEALLR
jgi:predicted aconitase